MADLSNFSISCSTAPMVVNSLNFCLYENVFLLLLFKEYTIHSFSLVVFSSSILRMSFHFLLASIIYFGKSVVILITIFLKVFFFFFLSGCLQGFLFLFSFQQLFNYNVLGCVFVLVCVCLFFFFNLSCLGFAKIFLNLWVNIFHCFF